MKILDINKARKGHGARELLEIEIYDRSSVAPTCSGVGTLLVTQGLEEEEGGE